MEKYIIKNTAPNVEYWEFCDTDKAKHIKKMILSIFS